MPEIDLIALDLDGTLLGPDDSISSANREAIDAAVRLGVRVVFVTGRGSETPTRLVRELRLDLPAICCHGALTIDPLRDRILGHIPVPLQYAQAMIDFSTTQRLRVAIYVNERFYRLAGTERVMDDMQGPTWMEVDDFSAIRDIAPTFIRFLGSESVAAMRGEFADLPLHFKYESWGTFEECAVTSREATKKNALKRLCADLQISSERVLAIGDSRNDVPMLHFAGIGVAMANALPEVREAVTNITASNLDDGVARAIERFVLAPRAAGKKKSA